MAEITKNSTFAELLQNHPECAEILMKRGMHCVGCPAAMQETIEQGCAAHGMSKEEIEELVKEVNQAIKKK